MSDTKKFYDRVRFAVHDILVHLHETWEAFSEAAQQMKMTPEQAEASLISKAVEEMKDEPKTDEEKIANYLKTSFVLSAAGLLPPALEEKLNSLCEPEAGHWKAAIVEELGVSEQSIRSIHTACAGTMTPENAVHFILRGLRVVPSIDALAHSAKADTEARRAEKKRK